MRAATPWNKRDACLGRTGDLLPLKVPSALLQEQHSEPSRREQLRQVGFVFPFLAAALLRRERWTQRHRCSLLAPRRSIKDGMLAALRDDPNENEKNEADKQKEQHRAYYSVVEEMINYEGRMPLSSFKGICKDAKVSFKKVLKALSFIAKESGDVVIASVDDLSVYCLLHHLEDQPSGSMRLGQAGRFLKDVFEYAPFLEEQRGKLKRVIQTHSDKLTLTSTGTVIFRKAWTYGSATKPKQKAEKKNEEPPREAEKTATASNADPFYSAVKCLIINEGRLELDEFEAFCEQLQLPAESFFETFSFISKEYGEDDDHVVTISSVDDLAAYCLVHHLQHNGGRMDFGGVGQFLSEELTPQISAQMKRKAKAIIQAHDDNLCYSASGNSVSLRRGWPYPSLPVEDVQLTELEEEAEDLDEASVDQTLLERAPVTVKLLRDAASLYLRHRLDLKLYKGALLEKPDKSDPEKLAKSFSESVRQHGILRLEVLLAEIDHACSVRGISPEELFQDRFVGEILAGYSKTLLFLESAIRASLASQPILTMHELEMILVSHPMFVGKARFEDALAGQLQFHPLVKEAFGLEHLQKIPDDFPVISSVELIGKLFSPPILQEMLCQGRRFSGKRSRSVLSSLSKLASEYSLSDWRLLGGSQHFPRVLAEWTALARKEQHEEFLVELAKLSTPERQQEFVASISETRIDWPKNLFASSAEIYVRLIFQEILQIAAPLQIAGDKSLNQTSNVLENSEAPEEAIPHHHQVQGDREISDEEMELDQPLAPTSQNKILQELCRKVHSKSGNLQQILEEIGRIEELKAWKDSGPSSSFGAWVAQNSASIADAVGLTTSKLHVEKTATAFSRSVALDVLKNADAGSLGENFWKRLTLESLREHFAGCMSDEELEDMADDALTYAARDSKKSLEESEDTLQLLRAAAAAGYFRPAPQETATGQDRSDLVEAAVEAVLQAPVLLDLAEALPEWDNEYGALGDLPAFLRSRECTLVLRQKLKDGCLMELNHGTFVRLPAPEECETGDITDAMRVGDGRTVAAIVVARLLREQNRAPVDLITNTIAAGYTGPASSNAEDFLLQAVGALPRQIVKVAKKTVDIIASGYLRLERPRMELVNAAFSPENSRCLHFQLALKRLGNHFAVDEWTKCSWQSVSKAATADPGTTRVIKAEEVVPEKSVQEEKAKDMKEPETADVLPVPKVEAVGDKTNKDLCWDIAALKKVNYDDVDMKKREWVREPEDEAVRNLQRTLQGAVKRLSEDLYSGEAHFLLELLQNVDDCQYPEGAKPTLRLTYESRKEHFDDFTSFQVSDTVDGLLVVEHNEAGFQEKNVRAICDIDRSTKTAREKRFIGAKGIGFKSVFLVTATPVIHSGQFHFHFDAHALNGLGSLLPFPLVPPATQVRGTRLVLPLSSVEGPLRKRSLRATDVATRALQDVRPTLLLFLQQLERVEAVDSSTGRTRIMTKEVLETQLGGSSCQEIQLKSEEKQSNVSEATEERWLVYTEPVQLESSADTEVDAVTELKLAFRLDKPAGVEQAYAWLPLRSYGLRFLIQADWRVPSSREAITEAVFNQRIRDQVPKAYAKAAKIFATAALNETSEDTDLPGKTWSQLEDGIEAAGKMLVPLYTSIPRRGDATDFFQEIDEKILRAAMDVAAILVRVPCPGVKESDAMGGSEDAGEEENLWKLELVTPGRAVRAELPEGVPASLSNLQQPIEMLLAQADRYVEVGGLPARAAEGLRVPVLDADMALDCLKAMGRLQSEKAVEDQEDVGLSDEDIEVLQLLLLIVAITALKKPESELTADVRNLQIIPTEGGKLVSLTAEEDAGFKVYDVPPDMAGIEALLGAGQRLDPRLSQKARPEVRDFLVRLGVEQIDGLAFFTNVLLPVLTQSEEPTEEKLVFATRQFRDLLSICEDQEKKDSLVEALQACDEGWWVLADGGAAGCKAIQVGGRTGRGLHVTSLPDKLASNLTGVDWLAPASVYSDASEAEDWVAFWMLLGAMPVFHVREHQGDFHSEELERLLDAAGGTPDLARELVALLEPHGDYYADYLWKPESQNEEPSAIAQLLCKQAWLPTQQEEVVPMNLAWLQGEQPSKDEARFTFDACVSTFAQAWPALGVEASPSPATLIAIVKHLQSKDDISLMIPEMSSLYSRIGRQQDFESRSQGETVLGRIIEPIYSLEGFIEEEPWIFVPNHPRPHDSFQRWYMESNKMKHRGKFYGLKQLVFKDKAECLDGFAKNARDDMIDLIREALDKRVVANYYFGHKTLLPATWESKGKKSSLHDLLSRYDVQEELDVSDYICVFKKIDALIPNMDASQDKAVRGLLGQILPVIALQVENEIREEEHRLEEIEDEEVSPQEPLVQTSKSLDMIRDQLSNMRFIPAVDGSWQPMKTYQFLISKNLSQIKDWPSAAQRFFVKPPAATTPVRNSNIVKLLKSLGLSTSFTLQKRACFVPVEASLNFDLVRTALAKEIADIGDGISSRLTEEDRALFQAMEDATMELSYEEVQKLSIDQVLVIDEERAKTGEIDLLDTSEDTSQWLTEFKPSEAHLVPVARIKSLPNKDFFIGQKDRKLVFISEGQLGALKLKDVSENLSKALMWTSIAKLAPELQALFRKSEPGSGLEDKARTFMTSLRAAIIKVAETKWLQGGSQESHETHDQETEVVVENTMPSDEGTEEQSESEDIVQKFLALTEMFEDLSDDDFFESMAVGEGANWEEGDEALDVNELLEQAGNALNYRKKRRQQSKQQSDELGTLQPKVQGSQPPVQPVELPPGALDVLSPRLGYDVAATVDSAGASPDGSGGSGGGGGGVTRDRGSDSDAPRAVDQQGDSEKSNFDKRPKDDKDKKTDYGEVVEKDFSKSSSPRDRKGVQQDVDKESKSLGRIVQAQRQRVAHPCEVPLSRIANELDAATEPTPKSSFFDVSFDTKTLAPSSSGSGGGIAVTVGRDGEQIAALSLKKEMENRGFKVLWLNEQEELGLPFDLLMRENNDFSAILDQNGAVDKAQVQELVRRAEAGDAADVRFVEVKSTTAGNKSIFEVSLNEASAMNSLGESFWLARVFGVPAGSDEEKETKVRVWENVAQAVRNGEVKLMMLV